MTEYQLFKTILSRARAFSSILEGILTASKKNILEKVWK